MPLTSSRQYKPHRAVSFTGIFITFLPHFKNYFQCEFIYAYIERLCFSSAAEQPLIKVPRPTPRETVHSNSSFLAFLPLLNLSQ